MKRDLDLIIQILEYVEDHGIYEGRELPCFPAWSDYNREERLYHLALCREAGLITDLELRQNDKIVFRNLTWAGHNTLDQLRFQRAQVGR